MIIEAYRWDGLRRGTPITEPMLSDSALLLRATAELNRHAQPVNQVNLSIVPRGGLRLGQLVESVDLTSAFPVKSKITGISISVSQADIQMNLTVEQPV